MVEELREEGRPKSKKTILVADDDVDYCLAVCDILEEENYEVIVATTGRQAMEKALSARPDLVLLDQQMPEMSGEQVFAALRAKGFREPMILISGETAVSSRSPNIREEECLVKPFDLSELLEAVEDALKGGGR